MAWHDSLMSSGATRSSRHQYCSGSCREVGYVHPTVTATAEQQQSIRKAAISSTSREQQEDGCWLRRLGVIFYFYLHK